jgi:hypothetical protein
MYCKKIATGVHHVIKNGAKISSFFIAEGSPWDAMKDVGELYLNSHDMHYFAQWVLNHERGTDEQTVLLISLDGKYGLVRQFDDIRNWNENASIHDFHSQGEDVFGHYEDFLKALDAEVERDPFLAEKLNYKPRAKPIPKRLKFESIRQDFRAGDMDREIWDAIQNPGNASDDALVWLTVIGEDGEQRGISRAANALAEVELSKRIQFHESHRPTFFPATEITLAEIKLRHKRARKNAVKFLQRFPSEIVGMDDMIMDYLFAMDSDQLAELAILIHYSAGAPDSREKLLIMALQDRYPGGW